MATTSTPRTFEAAIEALILSGVPRIQAVRDAVAQFPDLHQDFIDRSQRGLAGAVPPDRLRGPAGRR